MDDIFCFMDDEKTANSFLIYLNGQHENIKFTLEKEKLGKLPFLDVSVENTNSGIHTSVFKKNTDTGLLTNFNSFVCFKYKIGLIKTLFDRIFKINNTWVAFHEDLDKMKSTLQKNSFPMKVIDKHINECLKDRTNINPDNKKNEEGTGYFKLPYIGSLCLIKLKLR